MPSPTQHIGHDIERRAQRFLIRNGLATITTNYHSPYGEIDLIMQDTASLVFIEVRCRKNTTFGTGIESITADKQRKIRRTAAYFLQTHPIHANQPCRFDAVSIDDTRHITWIPHAFI